MASSAEISGGLVNPLILSARIPTTHWWHPRPRAIVLTLRFPISSWQRLFHIRQGIREDCHGGGVFPEFTGDDLVQGIGGGVVVVEIGAAVLHHAEGGNSGFGHSRDISSGRIGAILQDG